VKFFGRTTEFSTAPALLWQHTGAAVVPAFVLRNAEGRYTAFAAPAFPFTRSEDPRADLVTNTQLIATHFENVIRENPTQWFNYVPIWTAPASANGARG
jgi:lauroyl/myristoyl acyltransferase